MAAQTLPSLAPLARAVARRARDAGVFGSVAEGAPPSPALLTCEARDAASPAHYRLELHKGTLWVALTMADRWLSESIETDLVHTGDKLDELIDEELTELGYEDGPLPFEHFRDDDKMFVFRSPVPIDPARAGEREADVVATVLLAYEACFRNLGDMSGGGDD
ncbi:MAG: hypothetical protein FJ255_01350 [Phycisphaerae bacterium]|nr:hypothetical protein [Phycisphaerae bacterium]